LTFIDHCVFDTNLRAPNHNILNNGCYYNWNIGNLMFL